MPQLKRCLTVFQTHGFSDRELIDPIIEDVRLITPFEVSAYWNGFADWKWLWLERIKMWVLINSIA